MDASAPLRTQIGVSDPLPLGIGKDAVQGRDPQVALALAILVGAAVFLLLWKIRKTFGMRE